MTNTRTMTIGELAQITGLSVSAIRFYGKRGVLPAREGDGWQRWNTAVAAQLVRLQNKEGPLAGSWDPDSVWGGYGGRIYSTALGAMCLEVYYRFLPVYGKRG